MPGQLFKLEELSSRKIDSLNREKTVFLAPISPLEGHGPHLPTGVDYFNAIYFAETVARATLAQQPDFDVVIIPGIPLGTQVYRQPGSIRTGGRPIFRIVYDLGESLATWGFKYIFILSGHGAPKQIVALESACLKVSRQYGVQMHSLSGALAVRFLSGEFSEKTAALLSRPLTAEEKGLLKSDIHGGCWETSMMLLLRPDLVDQSYKTLPTSKRDSQRPTPNTGYIGSPAMASREFAEASLNVMSAEISETIKRIFAGKNKRSETVSPLYKMLIFRPYWTVFLLTAVLTIIIVALFIALVLR